MKLDGEYAELEWLQRQQGQRLIISVCRMGGWVRFMSGLQVLVISLIHSRRLPTLH